jgi:hypothetical protein
VRASAPRRAVVETVVHVNPSAASALALVIFVWVETRVAEPILPIRLFASPVFTVCCILGFIVGSQCWAR